MSVELDFSKVNDTNRRVEDGTYEVIIKKVDHDATDGGSEYRNFDLVIRNDIEQKFQNFHIWMRMYANKTTGDYSMAWIAQIAQAAGMENGKKYKSFDDLFDDFTGRAVKVSVKNEKSDWQGKEYENTNVKYWDTTSFPNIQHQWKEKKAADPFAGSGETIEVDVNDLPF